MSPVVQRQSFGSATDCRGLSVDAATVINRIQIAADGCSATIDGRAFVADDSLELRRELGSWVYALLHAGQDPDALEVPFHARDTAFEQRLVESVAHQWTTLELPTVAVESESVVVVRDGVRVRLPHDRIVSGGRPVAGTSYLFRVKAHRPLLSPGFFFLEGSTSTADSEAITRLYIGIDHADAAVEIWRNTATWLERNAIAYRMKMLSSSLLYPRRDALVVYFDRSDEAAAHGLAQALDGLPGLTAETSSFTRRLAQGIALADEPADPRKEYRGLSFGQHRAQVVVEALIEATVGKRRSDDAVLDSLIEANIDPQDLSRNLMRDSRSAMRNRMGGSQEASGMAPPAFGPRRREQPLTTLEEKAR